jgi:4-amino-4-deoxy-L-arabinose transferase-like glycosyltransferase
MARLAWLALWLELGFGLRVFAANLVQWYTQSKGILCIFPDTNIYWALAEPILHGEPFEVVFWGDLPHFALRTPGYPLFLAACRAVFGDRLLPVRLVQAALGTWCVWLVYQLVGRVAPPEDLSDRHQPSVLSPQSGRTVPLIAAALAAIDPFFIVASVLVLSEALFIPLLLLALWGLAVLWPSAGSEPPRRVWLLALGVGGVSGAAVLVRPSWALGIPLLLLAWVIASGRGRRLAAVRGAALVALGAALVMAPWWARNYRIYGRFVATSLWVGPSLYDGLNPQATGASDMDHFLNEPGVWPLGEEALDSVLFARALAFAREHPRRTLKLAAIKAARFWSPWPNAENLRAPLLAWASALYTLPLFALTAVGAWDRRRDARALVLLAGPLLYFFALHTLFVSSVRYRIPGFVPALGLTALGFRRIAAAARRGDG